MSEETEAVSENQTKRSIPSVVVGAWADAINSDWPGKVFLVLLVAFMTIPFAPAWVFLYLLERAGYYNIEEGF